jgi:hypothetical protein
LEIEVTLKSRLFAFMPAIDIRARTASHSHPDTCNERYRARCTGGRTVLGHVGSRHVAMFRWARAGSLSGQEPTSDQGAQSSANDPEPTCAESISPRRSGALVVRRCARLQGDFYQMNRRVLPLRGPREVWACLGEHSFHERPDWSGD